MLKLAIREPFFQQGNTHQPFMGCADTGVDINTITGKQAHHHQPNRTTKRDKAPKESSLQHCIETVN